MKFQKITFLSATLVLMIALDASAVVTWHVDARSGDDAASGQTSDKSFRTIQKAADVVGPGDTVIVHPGIYFEHVQLKTVGTAQSPIVFQADQVEKNRVLITGADQVIRNHGVSWQLDDAALQLYSVPLDYKPARVLYSGTDLMPYPTLQSLKDFRFADGYPGANHGFATEDGRLYVRLHAGDLYGPADPNKHTMSVSPPIGAGGAGVVVNKTSDYGFGVLAKEPAFVVFDGFTFETPGVAGVFVAGSHVTVRNSWFVGCHSGVAGLENSPDPTKTTNAVTIEFCDMTHFPTFADMKEVIHEHAKDPWRGSRSEFKQKIYWWHRKGGFQPPGYTYEVGIASNIGSDWIIRNNSMVDGFEFLSCWATRWSRNLDVYQNHLERLVDNAIEAEDHSVNLRFHDNVVIDDFEPFSWQPLGGLPWPGPVYFYRNVVFMTPQNTGLWEEAGWTPGIWKLGAEEENWNKKGHAVPQTQPVRPPEEGFLSFNNTIVAADHDVLTRVQSARRPFENFHIFNNVVVAHAFNAGTAYAGGGIDFSHNVAVLQVPADAEGVSQFTKEGALLRSLADLGTIDFASGKLDVLSTSPTRGIKRPESPADALSDAGAVPVGTAWNPPLTGPQKRINTVSLSN